MSEPKELATQLPSDTAIVRQYRETLARSPKDIRPGQAVLINKYGVAFGRPRYVRMVAATKFGIFGALIGGAVLAISGHWLPGALLYFVGTTPVWWVKHRGVNQLAAIDVLVRQGHLDEGQARLDAVPELRRRSPAFYCLLAGKLASHRGDYAAALKWWREGFPRSKAVHREVLKLSIATALLSSGRIEDARREYESVNFAPEADEVLTGQSLTRVMFVLCDPSSKLPPEDELHDWARRALEYSHTGVELAAIGWAFDRSGNEDMARFLATEAVERMHYPYLATWWPAAQQWLDSRTTKPEPGTAMSDDDHR